MECEAAKAFFEPCRDGGSIEVARSLSAGGSLLGAAFNLHWCQALNHFAEGDIHGFAMMHSDIGAEVNWLDILFAEMEKVGADIISAVVPIKDERGLTSTAIDDTGDQWKVRRLTTKEVMKFPETFTEKDVGGPLLLNTGLWLCRLGPWAFKTCFTIQDKILQSPDGRFEHRVIPEDWDFSRQVRRFGLKLAATRKVRINHWGPFYWNNQQQWGWDHDKTNAPEASPEKQEPTNGKARHDDPAVASVARPAGEHDHSGIELNRR
jgi:hypothetical protein